VAKLVSASAPSRRCTDPEEARHVEIIWAVVGFAVVMLLLWGVSYLAVRVIAPRRARRRILSALANAERIGTSDIPHDMKAATTRWIEMKRGVRDAQELDLGDHLDRLETQLGLMSQHAEALNAEERRIRNRDAISAGISDVLNS
jgi:hypothetical protein